VHKGKLLPPLYLLASLILAPVLNYYLPIAPVVPRPWNYLGALLVLAGLALIILPASVFSARGTAIKPFDESAILIQDGFFAFSRNPMYLGMVTLALGVSVWLGSATPFVAPLGLLAVLQVRFIRIEEEMLQAKFGDEYRSYMTRVRRWL
jgi:protein-S-isoprenylcysteine O-methyltransferase Ste14